METKHKNSSKRTAIYDALCSTDEHPSAEMLYERLKPQIPDLSLGTVYRNLSLFTEEGTAQTVCHIDGKDRFDGRTDDHPHFVCRKCGRVIDISFPSEISDFSSIVSEKYGFVPERCSLAFTGLCDRCVVETEKK